MKTRRTAALMIALMSLALAAAGCNKGAGSSPTATAKAFADAARAKDVEGIKKALSKGSLTMLEGFAKMQNKTLDEALKQPSNSNMPANFESRNEKITGDTATLEVKDEKGAWEAIPFVKEDGQWKIALDKAIGNAMNNSSSSSSGSSSGPAPSTPPMSNNNSSSSDDDEGHNGNSNH
ncbi:MAG TPA: hypothetical protein VF723_15840 [Pyrinomonadaceae bacterium]